MGRLGDKETGKRRLWQERRVHWYGPSFTLVMVIALAMVFDFLNGVCDSASLVATVISSGALDPRRALLTVAVAEFAGPFLFGTTVAAAIGNGIVQPSSISGGTIAVALGTAIGWNILALRLGMPSSSSHALVGGIVGASIAAGGYQALQIAGLLRVLMALLLAPFFGLLAGYVAMHLVLFLCRPATPRVNVFFKRSQLISSVVLALGHGTIDAQKTMAVIVMALVAEGVLPSFAVPLWVVAIAAGAISLGIAAGSWRTIRTLGNKIYRIRPVHGFTSQTASGVVVLGAALLGGPVSVTHVVSSTILGVGSAERVSKVRWDVAGRILATWAITVPASVALAIALQRALALLGS